MRLYRSPPLNISPYPLWVELISMFFRTGAQFLNLMKVHFHLNFSTFLLVKSSPSLNLLTYSPVQMLNFYCYVCFHKILFLFAFGNFRCCVKEVLKLSLLLLISYCHSHRQKLPFLLSFFNSLFTATITWADFISYKTKKFSPLNNH